MALLASFIALLQVSLFFFTRHRQRQLMAEGLEAQAKSQSYLVETLSAVELLKSLGAERRAAERWSGLFSRELSVSLRRGRLDGILDSLGALLRFASSTLLLGAGAVQVMAGQLTLGEMMALIAVANGFVPPLISLASTAAQFQVLSIHLERVNDVLQTPTEREKTGTKRLDTLIGTIAVEHVSFKYGPVSPLVLDEATSQLDAATERAVQEELAALACTRIVVAHRLSTVMNANRILVLENGHLVEDGTHAELVARNGVYARLVAAQMTADITMSH